MKHVVVGTAGHIDHGKTALVKALTGIDTDRLPEEKARGITIDLGFAYLAEPDGLIIEIVDVPGHERFVKNMLAGVGGIDLAMLVVAADEGVMPQTREHLAICRLLHIKAGLVALTKRDLVDPDWLDLVSEDVSGLLKGTFLEGAPIVPVSARTGERLTELRDALRRLAEVVPPKHTDRSPRLPIDRVFTVRGFGTVVTGTLTAGRLAVDERVEIYPKQLQAKVRGLQCHGRPVDTAVAGQRTAVNLQGVERAAIERGDVLGLPGALQPGSLFDATLELLADAPRPLKSRDRVRFHIGTSEIMARILLLDRQELAPGGQCYARLKLEGLAVALPGDRYVIRSYSPIITIGGGTLLDVSPPRGRRKAAQRLVHLKLLEKGTPEEVIEELVSQAGQSGLQMGELGARTALGLERLKGLLDDLQRSGRLVQVERDRFIHQEVYPSISAKIREIVAAFHSENPLRLGMSREELRMRAGGIDEKVFTYVLGRLEFEGVTRTERDKVRLASHEIRLTQEQRRLVDSLEEEFLRAGATPPSPEEALGALGLSGGEEHELFQLLVEERKLIRVKESLFFHARALKEIGEKLVAFLREKKEISPGDFKDLLGISRKYAIPLLEHFDGQRVTVRVGERRVLRGQT